MSSFTRRLGRKIAKKTMTTEEISAAKGAKTQSFRQHSDGSYDTYHPTRGWKHVSARRVAGQMRMAQLLGGF